MRIGAGNDVGADEIDGRFVGVPESDREVGARLVRR